MTRILDVLSGRHRPDAEALSAHLDNALDASRETALVAHVEICDPCRLRLAQLRDARVALRELHAVDPPRSFRLREAQVREATRVPAPRMRTGGFLPALSAAAVFVLVALVGADLFSTGEDDASDSSVRSAAERDTARGGLEMTGPTVDEGASRVADRLRSLPAVPASSAAAADRAATPLVADALRPETVDAPPPESTGASASGSDATDQFDRGATAQPPAPGAVRNAAPTDQPTTANAAATETSAGDDSDIGALRLAQIVAAAVAAIVGGATIIMWRRKTS